jgi:hypothetical protein
MVACDDGDAALPLLRADAPDPDPPARRWRSMV